MDFPAAEGKPMGGYKPASAKKSFKSQMTGSGSPSNGLKHPTFLSADEEVSEPKETQLQLEAEVSTSRLERPKERPSFAAMLEDITMMPDDAEMPSSPPLETAYSTTFSPQKKKKEKSCEDWKLEAGTFVKVLEKQDWWYGSVIEEVKKKEGVEQELIKVAFLSKKRKGHQLCEWPSKDIETCEEAEARAAADGRRHAWERELEAAAGIIPGLFSGNCYSLIGFEFEAKEQGSWYAAKIIGVEMADDGIPSFEIEWTEDGVVNDRTAKKTLQNLKSWLTQVEKISKEKEEEEDVEDQSDSTIGKLPIFNMREIVSFQLRDQRVLQSAEKNIWRMVKNYEIGKPETLVGYTLQEEFKDQYYVGRVSAVNGVHGIFTGPIFIVKYDGCEGKDDETMPKTMIKMEEIIFKHSLRKLGLKDANLPKEAALERIELKECGRKKPPKAKRNRNKNERMGSKSGKDVDAVDNAYFGLDAEDSDDAGIDSKPSKQASKVNIEEPALPMSPAKSADVEAPLLPHKSVEPAIFNGPSAAHSQDGVVEQQQNKGKGKAKISPPDPVARPGGPCFNCKQRKKGCDRVQPSCGLCEKRDLECLYPSSSHGQNNQFAPKTKDLDDEDESVQQLIDAAKKPSPRDAPTSSKVPIPVIDLNSLEGLSCPKHNLYSTPTGHHDHCSTCLKKIIKYKVAKCGSCEFVVCKPCRKQQVWPKRCAQHLLTKESFEDNQSNCTWCGQGGSGTAAGRGRGRPRAAWACRAPGCGLRACRRCVKSGFLNEPSSTTVSAPDVKKKKRDKDFSQGASSTDPWPGEEQEAGTQPTEMGDQNASIGKTQHSQKEKEGGEPQKQRGERPYTRIENIDEDVVEATTSTSDMVAMTRNFEKLQKNLLHRNQRLEIEAEPSDSEPEFEAKESLAVPKRIAQTTAAAPPSTVENFVIPKKKKKKMTAEEQEPPDVSSKEQTYSIPKKKKKKREDSRPEKKKNSEDSKPAKRLKKGHDETKTANDQSKQKPIIKKGTSVPITANGQSKPKPILKRGASVPIDAKIESKWQACSSHHDQGKVLLECKDKPHEMEVLLARLNMQTKIAVLGTMCPPDQATVFGCMTKLHQELVLMGMHSQTGTAAALVCAMDPRARAPLLAGTLRGNHERGKFLRALPVDKVQQAILLMSPEEQEEINDEMHAAQLAQRPPPPPASSRAAAAAAAAPRPVANWAAPPPPRPLPPAADDAAPAAGAAPPRTEAPPGGGPPPPGPGPRRRESFYQRGLAAATRQRPVLIDRLEYEGEVRWPFWRVQSALQCDLRGAPGLAVPVTHASVTRLFYEGLRIPLELAYDVALTPQQTPIYLYNTDLMDSQDPRDKNFMGILTPYDCEDLPNDQVHIKIERAAFFPTVKSAKLAARAGRAGGAAARGWARAEAALRGSPGAHPRPAALPPPVVDLILDALVDLMCKSSQAQAQLHLKRDNFLVPPQAGDTPLAPPGAVPRYAPGAAARAAGPRRLLFLGDSNVRGVYKDFVALLRDETYVTAKEFGQKCEQSFRGDQLILISGEKTGPNFEEIREFDTQKDGYPAAIYHYITKCWNNRVMKRLSEHLENFKPTTIVMNSSLWDLTRYAQNEEVAIRDYIAGLYNLTYFLQANFSGEFIWLTTMPVAPTPNSTFLRVFAKRERAKEQIEFLSTAVPVTNQLCNMIVKNAGYTTLDLWRFAIYHFSERLVKDGTHWSSVFHRDVTFRLLHFLENNPIQNRNPFEQ